MYLLPVAICALSDHSATPIPGRWPDSSRSKRKIQFSCSVSLSIPNLVLGNRYATRVEESTVVWKTECVLKEIVGKKRAEIYIQIYGDIAKSQYGRQGAKSMSGPRA